MFYLELNIESFFKLCGSTFPLVSTHEWIPLDDRSPTAIRAAAAPGHKEQNCGDGAKSEKAWLFHRFTPFDDLESEIEILLHQFSLLVVHEDHNITITVFTTMMPDVQFQETSVSCVGAG